MNSRDSILFALAKSKPDFKSLPANLYQPDRNFNLVVRFTKNATMAGAQVHKITSLNDLDKFVKINFCNAKRSVTNNSNFQSIATLLINSNYNKLQPHDLNDVDLTILDSHFGVAENGAVWITDALLVHRALPFITQHLILIVNENEIVHDLQEAYHKIGDSDYSYGVFISGPSKTADIEQSLVIGAHGCKSLYIFILEQIKPNLI